MEEVKKPKRVERVVVVPQAKKVFAIRPHPEAPLFDDVGQAQAYIKQISAEVASGHLVTHNKELRELLRQACFVSLYFFLKCVLAASGPYDLLNEDLHLDMCNWRQSEDCMGEGARWAAFLSRGFFKSTCLTHGGSTWEMLRWPDIRILLYNAIGDRAVRFMRTIARNWDSNPLVRWLLGEYVPPKNAPRWNERELVLPNRGKHATEPTIKPGGLSAASEGDHGNLVVIDDPQGLNDLTSMKTSGVDMIKKRDWFKTSERALLIRPKVDRIGLTATMYAMDDVNDLVVKRIRNVRGYRLPSLCKYEKEDGKWDVYFRLPVEGDVAVNPDVMTKGDLDELMREDPWTAMTQYMNNPEDTGLAELKAYEPKRCSVEFDDESGQWIIRKMGPDDAGQRPLPLAWCDVVMALDPAGTDKGISAKTSRSALGIWAKDWYDNKYLIWARCDYYNILKVFDLIFEGCTLFPGYVRGLVIETNAFQKVLKPLLERERETREIPIGLIPKNASIDKVVRIRNQVGMALLKGQVYLAEGQGIAFNEEREIFPQGAYKMDFLDMSEKAFVELKRPWSPEEREEAEYEEQRFVHDPTKSAVTGY